MTQDTMQIDIKVIDPTIAQEVIISNRYKSLPEIDRLPKETRRTSGYSNIMQRYVFN